MSLDLPLLKKVRCRFLNRSTGAPVPGVIASLSVSVGVGADSARFPVATLASDATGYMSFDLKPLLDLGLSDASGLFISAPQFGLADHDLIAAILPNPSGAPPPEKRSTDNSVDVGVGKMLRAARENLLNGSVEKNGICIVFPVYVDKNPQIGPGQKEADCAPMHLPSVQSPDIWDYKSSPYSFVTPSTIKMGDDCCETLLPSTLPVQQYRFNRIVIRQETKDDGGAVDPVESVVMTGNVDVSGALHVPEPSIKFGEILEFQQDWYSLGHSLGEIKYSLPLAPGESVQLAVIDWSRRDSASRTDNIRATEFLDHDLRRDRAIEDTVNAALKEEQGGNSFMGGTAGTASGQTYGSGMWTGDHTVGGGTSYSYGKRNLEAGALQDLHDRVRQASASVRSVNSTVIVQASQTEANALQTRRVANHNHCHALTIEYYEVLRQYRLVTRFSGWRPAVLIPFQPFTFSSTTWELALRFRTVLEQTLLDPSLSTCFEALIRLHAGPVSLYDPPAPPTNTSKPDDASKTAPLEKSVSVTTAKGQGLHSGAFVKVGDKVKIVAEGLLAMSGGNGYGSGGFPPSGDGKIVNNSNLAWHFLVDGVNGYSLVYRIGLTGTWRPWAEEITADTEGEIIFGVNTLPNGFADFGNPAAPAWTVALRYPSHVAATPVDPTKNDAVKYAPQVFRKNDDLLCEARLLRHLQDNQGYYNAAVWMLMDAVERRLHLEGALQSRPDILAGMDDRPLAISGNHVAFQFNGPIVGWDAIHGEESKAKDPLEDVVTLPTRGLFAEAKMGHCNSCERRDVTRNSDWTEMTVESPPEIGSITPGPKGMAPSIAQGVLPNNVIQITQPQAAPDPTGLANALSLLQTPNIFRDMSGLDQVSKLVTELAKYATDANTKAMATQAQVKIAQMQAEARGNGGETSRKQTPVERYDNLQVAREVAQAAQELGMSEQQKGLLTQQILGDKSQIDPIIRDVSADTLRADDFKYLVVWQFRDLVKFTPPSAVVTAVEARGMFVQRIADGVGDANIDQYTVRITKLPDDLQSHSPFTEAGFFEHVRQNFPKFLQPYPRTGLPESLAPFSTSDAVSWGSSAPLGAVLEFTIDPPMSPGFVAPILPERGLVLCTEYVSQVGNDHHWNFSTMTGPYPAGYHPVSGTRQFGLRAADGHWVFYIRAGDRLGGRAEWLLSEQVYEGQDIYWRYFQATLKKFVEDHGGAAEIVEGFVAHVPWDQAQRIITRPTESSA